MELAPYFIGALAGTVLAYLIFLLSGKSRMVARQEHEQLQKVHQDTLTQLVLAEDRLRHQQEIALQAQQQAALKEGEMTALLSRTASLEAALNHHRERLHELSQLLVREQETNRQQQTELLAHQKQVAEWRAVNTGLAEKLEMQKQDLANLQKKAHLEFEKLAHQIFEEKSGKFTEANKLNIESLLKPLQENIETFKKKVEETYDKESKERFSLEKEVKNLIENTQKISQEANNLASALKGQIKKQGDWGETILERILEMSGLVRDREYYVQGNLKDEEGQNLRPDIMVRLPDNRNIIIDSKVSLNAYLRYSEADTKEQQDIFIAQHLSAINQHIDQLSSKKYDELTQSLDFVIMFIPVEPAYILAVQADPELWAYAYTRRILLISPTNLIAVLKIVADLWKRELQNKNALEISRQGASLYDKFAGFVHSLEDIGKHITKAQDSYNQAMGQLKQGKGNLLNQAEKLKKLGVKSTKLLPPSMRHMDEEEDDAIRSDKDPAPGSDIGDNPSES